MVIKHTDYPLDTIDTTYGGGRNEYLHEGFSTNRYACTHYNIELVRRGRFLLYADNNVIEVKSGDLYIIPPYTIQGKLVLEEGTASSYLVVQTLELKRYIKHMHVVDNVYVCRPTEESIRYMEELIESLENYRVFESHKGKPEHSCYLQGIHWFNRAPHEAELRQNGVYSLFLSQLLHDHAKPNKDNTAQLNKDDYVKNAMQFIKEHFKEDISVDIVAQNIGLHRSYLYTLFQQYVGISICDYIIKVRIEVACDFLKHGNIPIKAIAMSVGYNPITFSRTFKKQMGITATEYQKSYFQSNKEKTNQEASPN